MEMVKTAYRSLRHRVPVRSGVLLHDNARPRTAAMTQIGETVLDCRRTSPLQPRLFHETLPIVQTTQEDVGKRRIRK